MNYKIQTYHEHDNYNGSMNETLYVTQKGLDNFIYKFKQAYIDDDIDYSVVYKDNMIIVDGEMIIEWSEYETPLFLDSLGDNLELNISNEGVDATVLMLDFYDNVGNDVSSDILNKQASNLINEINEPNKWNKNGIPMLKSPFTYKYKK